MKGSRQRWCVPFLGVALASCSTVGPVVGTILTLGIGANIKGHEIAEVYYVGAVDPLGQVPASLYRITVRGEASAVSSVRFESGWVKSELVDSLGTRIRFDERGDIELVESESRGDGVALESGRRMWLFGPEGFRRAPDGERLVVVMGSDPSAFFRAVGKVLGEVGTAARLEQHSLEAQRTGMLELLVDVADEQRELVTELKE